MIFQTFQVLYSYEYKNIFSIKYSTDNEYSTQYNKTLVANIPEVVILRFLPRAKISFQISIYFQNHN